MCSTDGMHDTCESEKPVTVLGLSQRDKRSLIFHILYALDAFEYDTSVDAVLDMFNRGYDLDIPLDGEIARIVVGIVEQRDAFDQRVIPVLHNWNFNRVSVSTKLILRIALWEFDNANTTPSIVINEAIELAKCFAEDDAYKFINGILDEIVKSEQK